MNITVPHPASFGSDVISLEYSAEIPYTALWYQNGPHYRGVNATYPMYQQPMGMYRPEINKTYLVWMNGQNPAWATIVVFNHATNVFEDVNKIFQMSDMDGHRSPTIHIDGAGYIYVFGGSHGDATQVWKSNAPYSTANWTKKASITGDTSYPQPHEMEPGMVSVFHRRGMEWGVVRSWDGFATVGTYRSLVSATNPSVEGVYALTRSEGNTIHMIWTVLDFGTQIRKHVWYAKSIDGGLNWSKSDGTPYTLPINAQSAEKIFDSGADQVNLQDLQIAPDGNVVAMFSSGTVGGTWSYKVSCYDGTDWVAQTIPAAADRQFDCGALLIESSSDFRAILPSGVGQVGEDGGNIEEWRSSDAGQTWSFHAALTADPYNHNNVKSVRDGHSDCRAFWGYGDAKNNVAGHLKFLSDSQGVEGIRPGNPYRRTVRATRNGTTLANATLNNDQNELSVKISQGALLIWSER